MYCTTLIRAAYVGVCVQNPTGLWIFTSCDSHCIVE